MLRYFALLILITVTLPACQILEVEGLDDKVIAENISQDTHYQILSPNQYQTIHPNGTIEIITQEPVIRK